MDQEFKAVLIFFGSVFVVAVAAIGGAHFYDAAKKRDMYQQCLEKQAKTDDNLYCSFIL